MGMMQKLVVLPGKHFICIVLHGELSTFSSVQAAGGNERAIPPQATCKHRGF